MLGQALKYIRMYHQLNQAALAQELNISRSFLSEIESNKKQPSIELLEKYSSFFGVPVSSLLFFSEHLSANNISEKGRVFIAKKILNIMGWLADKDSHNGKTN
ncbi:helix-turn-helix transcriptional regulator [Legionella dresdenensis]|uniref:Helix-turn-helix transcriptional regulator n=1 Tax=Legionella dresdenensis TaxID=450200 RepID=A0ABV8CHT3_9GAMM